MSFTSREFRDALGAFPTGVAIVTAVVDGERLGATVSSFNSVSLDPPLILFSIAKTARSYNLWSRADRYAVNILAQDQIELSNRFARASPEKWDGVDTGLGAYGTPLLPGTLAQFECKSYARYEGGDHVILVGEVLDLNLGTAASRPLVFHRGRYRQLDTEYVTVAPANIDFILHGW